MDKSELTRNYLYDLSSCTFYRQKCKDIPTAGVIDKSLGNDHINHLSLANREMWLFDCVNLLSFWPGNFVFLSTFK